MKRHLLERAWVDGADYDEWGNAYDKPFVQGGPVRHIIGRWTITKRWIVCSLDKATPMAQFEFEMGNLKGWGKRRTDYDGWVNVFQHEG